MSRLGVIHQTGRKSSELRKCYGKIQEINVPFITQSLQICYLSQTCFLGDCVWLLEQY